MKQFFIFFTLFGALIGPVFPQSNYNEGYVIKIDGDTVKGFIDNRSDFRNARFINFKITLSGDAIKYEPKDLVLYHVIGNKKYYSKDIDLNTGEKYVTRKLFMEALEVGRASLFYFKDLKGEEYFYVGKDTVFKRINSNTSMVTTQEGKTYLHQDKKYMVFINNIFRDCPSWKPDTDYDFQESSLRKAVRRYNNCFLDANTKSTDTSETNIPKTKVAYILQVGLNRSTVIQSGGPSANTELPNPSSQLDFSGGVGIDVVFPRLIRSFSFQLEVNYNQKGVDDIYSFQRYEFKHNIHTKYKMSFIDFSLMFKYTYPKGKVRPYLGFGGVVGYLLNKESAFKTTEQIDQRPPITNNSNMYDATLSYELGYCGEFGVLIPVYKNNKVAISLRYERAKLPLNGYVNLNVPYYKYTFSTQVFQFKVGYRFN